VGQDALLSDMDDLVWLFSVTIEEYVVKHILV